MTNWIVTASTSTNLYQALARMGCKIVGDTIPLDDGGCSVSVEGPDDLDRRANVSPVTGVFNDSEQVAYL